MYPLLLLLQAAGPLPPRAQPDAVPADSSVRAPAPARPAVVAPSAAPGAQVGPRDTLRVEDVSDETLERLALVANVIALGATLYVIILTHRSLQAALSANAQTIEANKIAREANEEARRANAQAHEEARRANEQAAEGLSAALYPQMREWLGVREIDGTPYLVLELQNDGPLPAWDLRIFVASVLHDEDIPASTFVSRYCRSDPSLEPLQPGPGGEYVVTVSMKHPNLWRIGRLRQPLHLDFGAERCVVILHFAHSHGRYYVQRTRYRRNESRTGAGDDLYTSEVDIELTETDGTDDQQEIIRKGIRGLKVDTALRDLWERHSVDWSRLKDRKRHRSVPRKE
jgi:hypothetical protein